MANFGLMQLCLIAYTLIKDMNYHCAKFLYQYVNKYGFNKYFPISRDFCTEILLFYPKIAKFGT